LLDEIGIDLTVLTGPHLGVEQECPDEPDYRIDATLFRDFLDGWLGGEPQASVIGADFLTTAVNAALANAMCAHADETDDVEPVTKAHPGSSVVPAALAIAEKQGRSGQEFIRAVALGYDLGCRLPMALGPDLVRGSHRSAEGTASTFAALGATASLARLDEQGMRFAISYSAQQVSGLWSWVKDKDHIEKAFDFAGMGARNGVTAVDMVQAGMTGVDDLHSCDGEGGQSVTGRDAGRSGKPILRHRIRDQDFFRRLSDPVAAGRPADIAKTTWTCSRQHPQRSGQAADRRHGHRRRERHAGRQLPAPGGCRPGQGRGLLRRQP
jgi:hypothetical protein